MDQAEGVTSAKHPAGAAAMIRDQQGGVLFNEAEASGEFSGKDPFADIVTAHENDPGTGCFAGDCAETRLARRILAAADENPRLYGRPIKMALFHRNGLIPCPTCVDVLQDLSNRMGSTIDLVTNTGRVFRWTPQ